MYGISKGNNRSRSPARMTTRKATAKARDVATAKGMEGRMAWTLMGRWRLVWAVGAVLVGLCAGAAGQTEAGRQGAGEKASAGMLVNPVTEEGAPIHMGDPFAFRAEGAYYLVGTTSAHEGFQTYRSEDLAHWQKIGWALRKAPGFWARDLFWAPEVRAYHGKYYMVYSGMVANEKTPKLLLALAVSDKPGGPYVTVHGPWFDPGYSAIDGDIFIDKDGTPYLYFSRNGEEDGYAYGKIYGVELTRDLARPVGAPRLLMQASQPWELVHAAVNRCNEGPTVFVHDGRYYMTYSAGDTSTPAYAIGYATARSPLGPWVKSESNPLLKTMVGSGISPGISGPGHNSIVASPNGKEMWMVYHTHADPARPSEDRVVNADRIRFDRDGGMHVEATRGAQRLPGRD